MMKIFNRVRTDKLEMDMAHYLAEGKTEHYEAIKMLAIEIHAPVDMVKTIRKAIEFRRMETFEASDLFYLLHQEENS